MYVSTRKEKGMHFYKSRFMYVILHDIKSSISNYAVHGIVTQHNGML